MDSTFIKKGSKIKASWFQITNQTPCLAGVMDKKEGRFVNVQGTVKSVRGNHPTNPTEIRLLVVQENGEEIFVDPKHVTGIQ